MTLSAYGVSRLRQQLPLADILIGPQYVQDTPRFAFNPDISLRA